jgi:hypothetical protein
MHAEDDGRANIGVIETNSACTRHGKILVVLEENRIMPYWCGEKVE